MSALLAELLGTMLLMILGNGVVAAVVLKKSKAENGGWIVITLGWGLAVTMAIYAVGQYSGAHINPAVTIAMAMAGTFAWSKVGAYIVAQMIGGFIGATIVWIQYLPHWRATEDQDAKLAAFSTGPAIRSTWANLVSEVIGTFILVTGLLFIGANNFTEGLNPIVVGALIVAIGMSLGATTGYAINPARDLAPRIAHFILPVHGKRDSDWSYAWIPVVGPIVGGLYGAIFYKAVFQQKIDVFFWGASAIVLVLIILAVLEEIRK